MRVQAVALDEMEHLLRLLTPQNEAVCRVCLAHGLRIGDVLRLRPDDVRKHSHTFREQKTGKRRKVVWTEEQRKLCLRWASEVYCFPSRCDDKRHRSRQAVFKDIKRAAAALRISGNLGTHSLRKTYAVQRYKACGDMRKVKSLLNHSDEAVTVLYALASEATARR